MSRNNDPSPRDIALKQQGKWASQDYNTYSGLSPSGSSFSTAIVADVISNPAEYLKTKLFNDELLRDAMMNDASGKGVYNSEIIDFIPRNTILAYPQDRAKISENRNPTVFLPFFPPHLCFPVKPGEHVWIFYDIVNEQKIGYWMCRKSGYRQIDDVNFTAMSRWISRQEQNQIYNNNLDNEPGKETYLDVLAYSFLKSTLEPIDPSKTADESIAYRREFIGEPVPRYTKKCGDLVLQGSNNTLISLGTDRSYLDPDVNDKSPYYGDTGSVYSSLQESEDNDSGDTTFFSNDNAKINDNNKTLGFKSELAGAIELVVGRDINNLKDRVKELDSVNVSISDQLTNNDNLEPRQSSLDSSKLLKKNIRGTKFESLEYYEQNKDSLYTGGHDEDVSEGSFYGLNDVSARLMISMRSNADMLRKNVKLGGSPADSHYDSVVRNKGGTGLSTILRSATTLQDYGRLSYDLSAGGANMHVGGEMLSISSGGAYNHLKDDGENELGSVGDGYLKIKTNGGVILHATGASLTNDGIELIEGAGQSFVRAENLSTELVKLKSALTAMSAALSSGGFCPFPAGPNPVLATAMVALNSALAGVIVEEVAAPLWISKIIKGE